MMVRLPLFTHARRLWTAVDAAGWQRANRQQNAGPRRTPCAQTYTHPTTAYRHILDINYVTIYQHISTMLINYLIILSFSFRSKLQMEQRTSRICKQADHLDIDFLREMKKLNKRQLEAVPRLN
ncbi:hypothetical protein HW555_011636 [Spodoptera exigua]|uniref:Uncharacterized protein n=1 Tax=Spodoptera exigua TaxID=7107 RepID=A0A835G8P2_SPOEX|nr:hypothetical protein HW555_011636 [Spodoptera exigua]